MSDQIESQLDLFTIRFEYSSEHRQFQIQLLCLVKDGTNVLWQTRATESKSGSEVIGRDVQLRILAKNLHHSVAINTHSLTEISDLIRETYLQCVKCVRGVLSQLSYRNGSALHRSFQAGIQSGNSFGSTIAAGADDRKGRMIEIMNCRGFTHELGIHANTEVSSILFTRFLFEQRSHHIVHRSR